MDCGNVAKDYVLLTCRSQESNRRVTALDTHEFRNRIKSFVLSDDGCSRNEIKEPVFGHPLNNTYVAQEMVIYLRDKGLDEMCEFTNIFFRHRLLIVGICIL